MTTPYVTIIIPTFNEEGFIERCLSSIKKLHYPSEFLNVIVADNGSMDRTKEIAQQFSVTVLNVPKKSIGYSRNFGANRSDSDYIAFVDADIVVDPSWLTTAILHFETNEQAVAVGSYPRVIPEESNRLQRTWAKLCSSKSQQPLPTDWLPSANIIVKRGSFNKIMGFNETLITCEDSDLGYRLKVLGEIINAPDVIVYHLREPKTFREFFRKELWHSTGNLMGFLNHGVRISELPSVLLPSMFGAGWGLLVINIYFVNYRYLLLGFLFVFIPLLAYTVKGLRKTNSLFFVICIYITYLAARSVSFYKELFLLLKGVCSKFFRM